MGETQSPSVLGDTDSTLPPPGTMPPSPASPPFNLWQSVLQWDKDVSYLMYRAYNANFSRLPLLALEVSAHGVPWIIAPVAIFLFKRDLSPAASALMLNFLALTVVDLAVIGVLKPLVHRRRPTYNSGIGHVTIHAVDQFSFPSGHATRVAFVTAFVAHARAHFPEALHPALDSPIAATAIAVWAVATCASRVALGRHHVLDVAAGAILGASYTVMWTPFWLSAAFAIQLRSFFQGLFRGSARMAVIGSTSHAVSSSQ